MNHLSDTQLGLYVENKIQWAEKFRSVLAMRGDMDYFDDTSLTTPANSGTSTTLLPSPKMSLIFGPWDKTEFYAQGGFSFHSNDGRGATQTEEPVSADNPNSNTPVARIPGLIQTKGAEIGVRTLARAAFAKHRFVVVSAQRVRTGAGWRHRRHRRFRTAERPLRHRMGELLHAGRASGF